MSRIIRRISYIAAAVFCSVISFIEVALVPVSAASSIVDYDLTDISEDLKDVSILKYPYNPLGEHSLILFQEYCFSKHSFYDEEYGLYLYVYNPAEKEIKVADGANVVNMATSYDEEGRPSSYANMPLRLLDTTDNLRFLKFKVVDEANTILTAQKAYQEEFEKRRYDVSGVQLWFEGDTNATDETVGHTYEYTGYAAGFGEGAEDTSTLHVNALETIKLDVKHTNYRMQSENTEGTYDEVNTVYFGVPERYFEEYGGLQKIKAEWYEYKTNPVFVTTSTEAYNALYDFRAVDIGTGTSEATLPWRVLWGQYLEQYILGELLTDGYKYCSAYNRDMGATSAVPVAIRHDWSDAAPCTRLDWIFQRTNVKRYEDLKVSSSEVLSYMENYTKAFPEQAKVQGKYADGLFASSIDEDRLKLLAAPEEKRGYIVQEIDAGEKIDLISRKDQSWWSQLWHGVQYDEASISPIEVLTSSIQETNAALFSEKYYVKSDDAETVKKDCEKMLENGCRPVLFRFAKTDYNVSVAQFDKHGTHGFEDEGYVAQATMFLDFDIISLTFRSKEGDTVIGVVSDPFDIVNGFDPAPGQGTEIEWWKLVLGLFVLVAFVALFGPTILEWLFDFIFGFFRAIGKGISKLFGGR